MKSPRILLLFLITTSLLYSELNVVAASFINLNFESANVPVVSGAGTNEPISKALPGWSAFVGIHPITEILHNNITLGDPSVAIFGPTSYTNSVISGQISAFLIAGVNENAPPTDVGASISQTAVIPSTAISILFKTRSDSSTFGLFANGNSLSLVPVFATNLFTVYGADISSYAGQNTEIKFTSFFLGISGNATLLDDISFSPNPIPEPSALALLPLAGLLWLGLRQRRRRIKP